MRLDKYRSKPAREQFVREAFNQIESLLVAYEEDSNFQITCPIRQFLITVRAALGYSPNTIDIDIWRSIRKTYYKIKTADELHARQR